jgi:hypothetical protein
MGDQESSGQNIAGLPIWIREVSMTYKVVLIKIDHRSTEAGKVQNILTEHGCTIKVRLGLHEVSKEFCANDGLIVLEVEGTDIVQMLEKLNAIEYVQAKLIEM